MLGLLLSCTAGLLSLQHAQVMAQPEFELVLQGGRVINLART